MSRTSYVYCTPCGRVVYKSGNPMTGDFMNCPHLFGGSSRNAQSFEPVVVHVDKDGNVRFPGRADAKVPKGYEKRELTTVREVRKFEGQMNERERRKWSQHLENEERF